LSRFDARSTLIRLLGIRGNGVSDAVVLAGKAAITHVLVRRIQL
jgi:hypothetical protein